MSTLASLAAALVGAAVGAAVAVTLLAKPAPACDTDLIRAELANVRAELVALRAKLAEAPAPPEPAKPSPGVVQIQIVSDPPGAEVIDDAGRVLGRTPVQIAVPPSSTPRQFRLRRPGYSEQVFELTPDKDTSYSATLAKRAVDVKNPYRAPDSGGDLAPNPFDSPRPSR